MELANKLLDLIRNERYASWPRQKLIEKADEFKQNHENKILIKKKMEKENAKPIYTTVSDALKNSKDSDIIVTACGLYKVFATYKDYLRYITSVSDKFGKIDSIPHFQIIPDGTVQNLVICYAGLDAEVLQDIIDKLLVKFEGLRSEHIRCFPANEYVFIVLTNMCGSFSKNHHKILNFIDDNRQIKLICLQMIFDQETQKSYIRIPIRLVECVSGDMCKVTDPKNHINITNVKSLLKKPEIESPEDWIRQNSPMDKSLSKYYKKFIKSTGCDMSRRKFHELVEKRGYSRKKTNSGFVWVR